MNWPMAPGLETKGTEISAWLQIKLCVLQLRAGDKLTKKGKSSFQRRLYP